MKGDIMDVTFLAIIAEKRPDLMDHDDIRKMASAITKNITKNGEMQAAAKIERRKRAGLKAAAPAKKRGRKRRARGAYQAEAAAL